MPDDSQSEMLVSYLGADAARAVALWADINGHVCRVPSKPWRSSDGYSGASLRTLIVDSRQLILKLIPPGDTVGRREPVNHRAALSTHEQFAAHIVEQPFEALPTASGAVVMFQALAGDGANCVPLSELGLPLRKEGAVLVIGKIIRYRNAGLIASESMKVSDFLGSEAGKVLLPEGSVLRWAEPLSLLDITVPWVSLDGRGVLPNPVILASDPNAAGEQRVEVVIGRAHRDLHELNILVPLAADGRPRIDRFQLIDHATLRDCFSLTHDPVFLMLSSVATLIGTLPASQWDRLVEGIIGPPVSLEGPSGIVTAIREEFEAAVEEMRTGLMKEVRVQFLLSTLALALVFTTFESLGPLARWRFFELSAMAADRFVRASGALPPAYAPAVANPFTATQPTPEKAASRPDPLPALEEELLRADAVERSGSAKRAIELYGQILVKATELLGGQHSFTRRCERRYRSPRLHRRAAEEP